MGHMDFGEGKRSDLQRKLQAILTFALFFIPRNSPHDCLKKEYLVGAASADAMSNIPSTEGACLKLLHKMLGTDGHHQGDLFFGSGHNLLVYRYRY